MGQILISTAPSHLVFKLHALMRVDEKGSSSVVEIIREGSMFPKVLCAFSHEISMSQSFEFKGKGATITLEFDLYLQSVIYLSLKPLTQETKNTLQQ